MWHLEFLRLRTQHRVLRRRRHLRIWTVERMEERTLLSTFYVTNTGDNGGVNPAPGAGTATLRQAIIDADADTANTAADTIAFNIPGSGVQTIQPLSQLPIITHPVFIDGYSQPGSKPNDQATSDDAVLLIELDGASAGRALGLWTSCGNSTVMGLVINRFQSYGIYLTNTGGNVVEGNFLGTDPTGEYPLGNGDGADAESDGNRIGIDGNNPCDIAEGQNVYAERNLVSGNNSSGIGAAANQNIVAGNFVGTDASGTQPLGNSRAGINVNYGSSFNRIGTDGQSVDNLGEANVISCNGGGIDLGSGAPGQGNFIAGNFIGTDINGNPIARFAQRKGSMSRVTRMTRSADHPHSRIRSLTLTLAWRSRAPRPESRFGPTVSSISPPAWASNLVPSLS